ncbi:hypothetical protein U14_00660 [Candidatus Moduliflexus flocculans]|uniref:Sulfatase-modifying factor enzyme-like domain-containing protein n=1 Tax=Candidatus Moduliflexus flocculans TaxID=1499966 RepID=A0A0S6VXA6_9BACT|nr:hypothetical protein U14_00660 [Candidatus Moduliflexus flocculans]
MSQPQEKVYIKLADAGSRPQTVASVLSRIQGLKGTPEDLIAHAPCYISERVSLMLAEKVRDYLERAGARVEFETEEVPDNADPQMTRDEYGEAYVEFETPSDAVAALEQLRGSQPPISTHDADIVDMTPIGGTFQPSLRQALTKLDAKDDSSSTRRNTGKRQPEPVAAPVEEPRPARRRVKFRSSSFPFAILVGAVLLALLGIGVVMLFSGYFPGISKRYEQNTVIGQVGVLSIENPENAEIGLFQVVGTRVIKQVPLQGNKINLKLGDYYIEARRGNEVVRFPAYIKGRGHRLTVNVKFPSQPPFSNKVALIPAGWFRIGNKDTEIAHFGFPDESPDVDVYVDEIFFSKYEVTNREFAEFVNAGGYNNEVYWQRLIEDWPSLVEQVPAYGNFYGNDGWKSVRKYIRSDLVDTDNRPAPRLWEVDTPPYEYGQDEHPVFGITMYEADAYCKWLSEQTGRIVRLPTEVEWEKAAKGYEGYVFSYGNEYDPTRANTENQGTQKIGSYPPNSYGLYDMTGNVWEWVTDQYRADTYKEWQDAGKESVRNPRVFNPGKRYDRVVVRGGSFRSVNRINARTPVRYAMYPNYWHTNIGFRYVIEP